jgi:hypothetical protein
MQGSPFESTDQERTFDNAAGDGRRRSDGADTQRLGTEFARLAAKAIGRAREEAEDIWTDAQGLRERPVLRRTATYGLAGLLRAGDAVSARARDVAAHVSASAPERSTDQGPPGDGTGSRDVVG